MDGPEFTHESRYLVILAGAVLERQIQDHAREIAVRRSADEIAPEDVEMAVEAFLDQEFLGLPKLIEQAINKYKRRTAKAA